MHNEFVVEFKDGSRDWVDPVDGWESVVDIGDVLEVTNSIGVVYEYEKSKIEKWCVRPYSEETTYDKIS